METLPTVASRPLSESDDRVIQRVLAGDRQAYGILMTRHNQRLYRVARALMRDAAEAEDVVQESWVRAFQQLAHLTDRSVFRAWVTRVTVNEALGRRRQRLRRELLSDTEVEMTSEDNPEAQTAQRELRPVLEAAVSDLPELLRAVFVLREVDGMPVADVAELLGIQEATVKTRAFRARELLRARLNDWSDAAIPELFAFAGERCARISQRVLERLESTEAAAPKH